MSHFSVLVLLAEQDVRQMLDRANGAPSAEPAVRRLAQVSWQDLEEIIGGKLAPYDENTSVPEYDTDCYCLGRVAKLRAEKKLDNEMGSWEQARTTFNQQQAALATQQQEAHKKQDMDTYWRIDREINQIWKTEVVQPREKRLQEILAEQPDTTSPNPDCSECKGSGKVKSTYNPLSHWDWWQIGGRWTGAIDGYDPENDPANRQVCRLCGGTGVRTDMVVRNGCNGCNGTGIETKWPTEWAKHTGDVCPTAKLPADMHATYALVTPDGEWHTKGKMGWWGISTDEDEEWPKRFRELLAQHQDTLAVIVDAHI